jgi:hypothetical protein
MRAIPRASTGGTAGGSPGYTNRKPKHQQESGLQPYVLLRGSSGALADATAAARLLREAETSLQAANAARGAPEASPAPAGKLGPGRRTPAEEYAHYATPILQRYPSPNYSLLDWMACRDIASRNPDADQDYLMAVLRAGSPHIAERKVRHVEDYVARTAEKVLRDPEVVVARQALARQSAIDISP